MLAWLFAAAGGAALALLLYAWREPSPRSRFLAAGALRAAALTILLGLLLDAPIGPAVAPDPLVALDVSASWQRGAGAWDSATARLRALRADSVLLLGDSARFAPVPERPEDRVTTVREAVDRALAAGRALVLVTDGEIDDPQSLDALPGGSRVEVIARPAEPDVAVRTMDVPQAAVGGDTVQARITIVAGAAGAPAGQLEILAGDRRVALVAFDSLGALDERELVARFPLPAVDDATIVRAIVAAGGDAEPRNDTLTTVVDVSRAAGAVYVSTSPDQDARFAIAVLRGAVALPTRAYFRVAPGQWRREGTLAAVPESEVRDALRGAPIAIVHGDTAIFGAPRAATRGSLALHARPAQQGEDWYPTSAPPSPLAAVLSGIPWDSLPPIDVSASVPAGDWIALEATRSRRLETRRVITGSDRPRRVVVVGGSGFWRWRFRGGESGDAFTALWGSIFDWLAADRRDPRPVVPDRGILRSGDPVRWRRGADADTVIALALRALDGGRTDTLMLRFDPGANVAESPALPPGTYEAVAGGGRALLAVNQSREWLPRAASVQSGEVGGGTPPGDAPSVRERWWAYALLLLLLCAEWVLRRRQGLR